MAHDTTHTLTLIRDVARFIEEGEGDAASESEQERLEDFLGRFLSTLRGENATEPSRVALRYGKVTELDREHRLRAISAIEELLEIAEPLERACKVAYDIANGINEPFSDQRMLDSGLIQINRVLGAFSQWIRYMAVEGRTVPEGDEGSETSAQLRAFWMPRAEAQP